MVYAQQMQEQCWMQNKHNMNDACETNTTLLVYAKPTQHDWCMPTSLMHAKENITGIYAKLRKHCWFW